jgi:hypothetical protein
MKNWVDTIERRLAGDEPGFCGADESLEHFADRHGAEIAYAPEPASLALPETWTPPAAVPEPLTAHGEHQLADAASTGLDVGQLPPEPVAPSSSTRRAPAKKTAAKKTAAKKTAAKKTAAKKTAAKKTASSRRAR